VTQDSSGPTTRKINRPLIRWLGIGGIWLATFALSTQGWRARPLASDFWIPVQSVTNLLANGEVPDHGVLSSYGSYITPGSNFFFIPGVALTGDPRAWEFPGSALLHLGTLCCLFLLCRQVLGVPYGWMAVAFYSISIFGLRFAGSLWPRAPPFFCCAFLYTLLLWRARRNNWYLALSIILWMSGMYYFMEMAPILVCLPMVWFLFRPRLGSTFAMIAIAGLLGLGVWIPYLKFERAVGFQDLASLIERKALLNGNPPSNWCDNSPDLRLAATHEPFSYPVSQTRHKSLKARVMERSLSTGTGLVGNFSSAVSVPGGGLFLFLFCAAGLWAVVWQRGIASAGRLPAKWWILAGGAMTATGLMMIIGVARGIFGWSASFVGAAGTALAINGLLIAWGGRPLCLLLVHTGSVPESDGRQKRCFAWMLLICWIGMLLLAGEVGSERRFWWLWPFQVIWLTFTVGSVMKSARHRSAGWIALAACVLLLAWNPLVISNIGDWRTHGWSGADDPAIRAVDEIGRLEAPGAMIPIGYQISFPPWFAWFSAKDPIYRVGHELDLQLWQKHGIRNSGACLEGFSSKDRYRVVQLHPPTASDVAWVYINGISLDGYTPIADFGDVRLYRRK
jgi:hypothetical protein